MYEFNLVLLLLQQMCVFLVTGGVNEQNAPVHPAYAGHGSTAAQAPVLRHVFYLRIMGTYFGPHIED